MVNSRTFSGVKTTLFSISDTASPDLPPGAVSATSISCPGRTVQTTSRSISATDPKVPDHFVQIEERNGKTVPDPEQQLDPGFDLTPDSYSKFIAWHLGRFAQQSFASGVFPTDEMFQDKARRLVYGSDDNWEQTIADNEQWIATFRRQRLSKQ
ncbi:uncharacterized protein FFB14_07459 [Fusarium fujikuroi]|nr:uncharacterized protein FFB14_07459 [Fusarium fujikuroi]